MLINMWMLKGPNGMFWYAVDYLRRLEGAHRVIVRPALVEIARNRLDDARFTVVGVGLARFLLEMAVAVLSRRPIYCPTPHPLPGYRRQWITFHDAYPFEGRKGRIKELLMRFGVASSGCRVGYINRSAALPFLRSRHIPEHQLIYAPNMPPPGPGAGAYGEADDRVATGVRILGAFGTDSTKKDYETLIEVLRRRGDRVHLHLYGEEHPYIDSLRRFFPDQVLKVFPPSKVDLHRFVGGLDAVVGIARGEGFGRPLATAIVAGVPCYLLDAPTFREFFDGAACFEPDVDRVVAAAVAGVSPVADSGTRSGFASVEYAASIAEAAAALATFAECGRTHA